MFGIAARTCMEMGSYLWESILKSSSGEAECLCAMMLSWVLHAPNDP